MAATPDPEQHTPNGGLTDIMVATSSTGLAQSPDMSDVAVDIQRAAAKRAPLHVAVARDVARGEHIFSTTIRKGVHR